MTEQDKSDLVRFRDTFAAGWDNLRKYTRVDDPTDKSDPDDQEG
jgi:hypothetical protein